MVWGVGVRAPDFTKEASEPGLLGWQLMRTWRGWQRGQPPSFPPAATSPAEGDTQAGGDRPVRQGQAFLPGSSEGSMEVRRPGLL